MGRNEERLAGEPRHHVARGCLMAPILRCSRAGPERAGRVGEMSWRRWWRRSEQTD